MSGPDTLDGRLAAHAAAAPSRVALQLPRGRGFRATTFGRLEARVDALAAGLRHAGIEPGMRTALLVPPTEDFFALAFALLRLRAVPVLVDPGIGRDNVKGCLATSAPAAFVGVVKAQLARRLLGWAPGAHTVVTVGPGATGSAPVWGGRSLRRVEDDGRWRRPFAAPPPGSPAAILFTSGSTGPPKGVEHGPEQLVAQADSIATLYGLGPDDVSLSTFPPFALYGPALGMTTVVPRMDPTRPAEVVPARVVGAANRFGATVLFGSPALLDTVSRAGGTMPSLRRVISAGAPVPRTVQRRTLAMLSDGAQVYTPYGATEALPVASIGSDELLALPKGGICVGRPVPGVEVALVRVSDEPISELTGDQRVERGEIGEVLVRGPVVSPAYADRPDANAAAKVRWDGQVAHRMGDLASLDDHGRLWFAGRKVHVVHTAGGPLYSVPCEEVFNAHPAVRRSALVGVPADPARGGAATTGAGRAGAVGARAMGARAMGARAMGARAMGARAMGAGAGRAEAGGAEAGGAHLAVPVLVVELEPGQAGSSALTAELLAVGAADERTAPICRVRYHPGLPVDIRHNSKIDRVALGTWAAAQP